MCQGIMNNRVHVTMAWTGYGPSRAHVFIVMNAQKCNSVLQHIQLFNRALTDSSPKPVKFCLHFTSCNVTWLCFEGRGRAIATLSSYSGDHKFKSLPVDRLSRLFSWFSWVPPSKCWGSVLKLGHSRFLPDLFKFIIHLSLHSTLHSLSCWKCFCKLLECRTMYAVCEQVN
jgi:hypothetical protein